MVCRTASVSLFRWRTLVMQQQTVRNDHCIFEMALTTRHIFALERAKSPAKGSIVASAPVMRNKRRIVGPIRTRTVRVQLQGRVDNVITGFSGSKTIILGRSGRNPKAP